MSHQKTCLVVVFNHNFERNIPIIRKLHEGRFSRVIQLMPFYSGKDPDVIRVFGNSFQFHGYIAQARRELLAIPCDRYLFIGDDLVLNPAINESTLGSLMKLDGDKCFHPGFQDVSRGEYYRGTMEAHNFQQFPSGIDASALAGIPSYEEAFSILNRKGLLATTKLSRIRPFLQLFEEPWLKAWRQNLQIIIDRAWHLRNALKYRLRSQRVSYPVVFGYSDVFSVPRVHFERFCDCLGVFAAVGMFVELAIPTTFALHDWPMVYESEIQLEPLSLWFPLDPKLLKSKGETIKAVAAAANCQIAELNHAFPKNLLYLHPVKLSKWA